MFNSNDGIKVTAGDKQIVVYGLNYDTFTSDAFLALPCSRLTVDHYEYYGITYSSGGPSQLLFVGCEDGTTITIGSSTFTLNQMETYLYEVGSDLTGTRAVSNKPVSFFSGHRCTAVPSGIAACDHINEQLPNTTIWGTRFLSASLSSRSSGDIYRILASHPSTTVTFRCSTLSQPSTYTLSTAGSWQMITISGNSVCAIESNNPLLVIQFGLGGGYDSIGDPFMMMLPPIEQYSNNYVFNVLSEFSMNFITLFVAPEYYQPEKIFVHDASQSGNSWTSIYCVDGTLCGYTAYASLAAGEHRLYHTDTSARVGVSAYGFNSYNSYGYPGGLQLVPIQCT